MVATTVVASSTIKGATTIAVGNATPSASGAGITFPATQSASTDANTLDDYEEGTWTPTKGTGVTGTVASGTGTYTKIGNVVTVSGVFQGSGNISMSTRGQVIAAGLPYAADGLGSGVVCNNAGEGGACIVNFSGALYYTDSAAITASSYFYFAFSYKTA